MSDSPKNIKPKNNRSGTTGRAEIKPPKKITETYLHNAGLHYLQRFASSKNQFRTVMQRKIDRSCRHHPDPTPAECAAMLDTLILRFEENGLLNDIGYARGMVNTLRNRGLSQRAIIAKLQTRGLPEGQIKDALEYFNTENGVTTRDSELKSALNLARKKRVGPYAGAAEFDYDRALAAFARAGFSFDLAKQVLNMTPEEIEQ